MVNPILNSAAAIPLSKSWECARHIIPNRGQTFFPATTRGAVYDVTITGTIAYRFRLKENYYDPVRIVRGSADAMYMTTGHPKFMGKDYYADSGRFKEPHNWFRLNDQAITESQLLDNNGKRDPWGLKTYGKAHIYRLRIEGLRETLFISCEPEADLQRWNHHDDLSFITNGRFTVSVVAWAPDVAEPRKKDAEVLQLIEQPKREPTAEELRQRKVLEHSRAIEDRLAIVEREIEIEQAVIERVARKYPDADEDLRQRMVQRILERMYEDEDKQNVETL